MAQYIGPAVPWKDARRVPVWCDIIRDPSLEACSSDPGTNPKKSLNADRKAGVQREVGAKLAPLGVSYRMEAGEPSPTAQVGLCLTIAC